MLNEDFRHQELVRVSSILGMVLVMGRNFQKIVSGLIRWDRLRLSQVALNRIGILPDDNGAVKLRPSTNLWRTQIVFDRTICVRVQCRLCPGMLHPASIAKLTRTSRIFTPLLLGGSRSLCSGLRFAGCLRTARAGICPAVVHRPFRMPMSCSLFCHRCVFVCRGLE